MVYLWETFLDRVKLLDYTESDLRYCSEELLLTIIEETGAFSPLQIPSIVKEWRSRYRAPSIGNILRTAGTSSFAAGPPTAPPTHYPAAEIRNAAAQVLRRLAGCEYTNVEVQQANGIIAVEACPADWHAFRRRASDLQCAEPRRLWKLCSPTLLSKIQDACTQATPLALSNEDDADALCTSAIVLYLDEAQRIHCIGTGETALQSLAHQGWALVAFDALLGRQRVVTAEEAQNLSRFSMRQCQDMLADAGYDSLSIPTHHAVLLCHPQQLIPRSVVFFHVEDYPSDKRRLDYSTNTIEGRPMKLPRASTSNGLEHSNSSKLTTDGVRTSTACDTHPQRQVEFWCPNEHRLLCSHCLYYDSYSRENCLPIEHATRQEVPQLERWVANAATFTREVQKVFSLFDAAKSDIRNGEEITIRSITTQFSHLREKLNVIEADLLADVRERSRLCLTEVDGCQQSVADTVGRVSDLVRQAAGPLKQYQDGTTDIPTSLHLLRTVQRALGGWTPIAIPSYTVTRPTEGMLAQVDSALATIPGVLVAEGRIELPEAIDVTYLRVDAER